MHPNPDVFWKAVLAALGGIAVALINRYRAKGAQSDEEWKRKKIDDLEEKLIFAGMKEVRLVQAHEKDLAELGHRYDTLEAKYERLKRANDVLEREIQDLEEKAKRKR